MCASCLCLVLCLVCQRIPHHCVFSHSQTLDPLLRTPSPQHSHPVPTNLRFTASKMATPRDAEYNQISLNTCVLLDDLSVVTGIITPPITPAQVPRQRKAHDEGTSIPFSCSDVGRESSSNSTQIAESHGRPSLGPSGQPVEVRVTGLFFAIP